MNKVRFYRDVNDTETLSDREKRRLSVVRKRMQAGIFITLDELKTRLGLTH